jgi:hypothetical protein
VGAGFCGGAGQVAFKRGRISSYKGEQRKVEEASRHNIQTDVFITMFRKAAKLRNEMNKAGFTDNAGAIHSAERILNILGLRLNYPGIGHINNLRRYQSAVFSKEAWKLHQIRSKVLIEHVSPLRDLTRQAIEKVDRKISDKEFKKFVKRHYKLVLLSPAETVRLNKLNRSTMSPDRLRDAGIQLADRENPEPNGRVR